MTDDGGTLYSAMDLLERDLANLRARQAYRLLTGDDPSVGYDCPECGFHSGHGEDVFFQHCRVCHGELSPERQREYWADKKRRRNT